MFCKVVGIVVLSLVPVDTEFVVRRFVAEPIPAHVPCFGAALLDVGMDEAIGCRDVGFEWSSGLGMAQCT